MLETERITTTTKPARATLLNGFSLEMTGKDVHALHDAAASIAPGTRLNVTYLGSEDGEMRVAAARALRELGLVPVPHIPARRMTSASALDAFLAELEAVGACENVFVIGGDPAHAEGPFEDALAVINSGLFERHGVRRVGIAGYPEGHPGIDELTLRSSLAMKATALAERGLAGEIITQFGFDSEPVLAWIEAVRATGIEMPIRVGVPGPAGARRLLAYAKRCGVGTGASIAKKYGLSLTNLMSTSGPDRFLAELAAHYEPARHGSVGVHFYTFGGLGSTAKWIKEFLAA